MYLKRLESVGFKSFAERINIAFVPGVTAVVGPNGSGKSNITDAVRWVLGEQSVKSLRGTKMEDVIFQGSDTRNPLNFAEVTLVLDNRSQILPLEYEEVSVTRRVYRSGDSEFYINKQSCRLKDIIDLFMDSGLGQDSFSIISQGRVEEVLSSKADERRTIFEEAAGVLKYKHRKRKAEFKLVDTQENLNRIDDIIHEIKGQIDPLKKQSEIAVQYKEYAKQLEKHEITLLVTEIKQLHAEWKALLAKIDEEKMHEIQLKTSIQKREALLESKRDELQKVDQQIESLQADLLAKTQEVEQYEGKKQVLHERAKHYTDNKHKLSVQKDQTKTMLDSLRMSLTKEEKTYNDIQIRRENTHKEIERLTKKLTTDQDELHVSIESLKSEYIEQLNKQAAHRNEQQSIKQQLKQLHQRKSIQMEKTDHLAVQQEALQKKKTDLWNAYAKQKQSYANKEANNQTLKKNLNEIRDHFTRSQEKLFTGYQTIAKLTSRKEMLEEMKEDFQGFFHGVKAVLKKNKLGKFNGVHGAVIECIDVPEQYVIAIETALGGQAQHVVVENDQVARDVIKWLKDAKKGRATFLPLASIQDRTLTKTTIQKVKTHAGFIGTASQLVQTSAVYEKVVNHLMGHVLIAKTLKDANELAQLTAHRHRIVTLDGDVVNPGGSMTGGAQRNVKQSLFTREKDLQELTKQLTILADKSTIFEQEVAKQKQAIENLEKEIEAQEQLLTIKQEKFQHTHTAYKKAEAELTALDDTFTFHRQDQQQFTQDKLNLEKDEQDLMDGLTTVEQQLVTIQQKITDLTAQKDQVNENEKKIQHDIHQYQISFAEQEERVRNQHEKMVTIQKELKETEKQYEIHSHELAELVHLQESETTTEKLNQEIDEKKQLTEVLTNQVQDLRTKRLKETQTLQDEERELKEENKKHGTYIESIQKQEVQATRLDVALENHLSTLQTDYTTTFENASQIYGETSDIEKTKANVNHLKESIAALGNVNLGSIEEYKRISERFEFLTEQKTDLIDAKQTLHSIITEMDHVMKKRFEKTFLEINKQFSVVFKELFGGGHASLTLTDPDNMLDTGIEIIAQPPGKKLQHIGLLSGGERALTAISLLFSILRVRPVPFCVLDEVEAALDEANVVRFARYVKLHSVDTQFIVITHRKGTMEEADVLYGVTMQESGVSRLVSVQLEEAEPLVNI